jgi:hypothetical protein
VSTKLPTEFCVKFPTGDVDVSTGVVVPVLVVPVSVVGVVVFVLVVPVLVVPVSTVGVVGVVVSVPGYLGNKS